MKNRNKARSEREKSGLLPLGLALEYGRLISSRDEEKPLSNSLQRALALNRVVDPDVFYSSKYDPAKNL